MTTSFVLFGPPQLTRQGQVITVGRRKAMALLVYLAATGLPQSRDTLAALLWPEASARSARGNLRRALSDLNRAVGRDLLSLEANFDMLSLGEIADEIARSLDFLQAKMQGIPDRQRSMRAVFDRSWERLSRGEEVFALVKWQEHKAVMFKRYLEGLWGAGTPLLQLRK